MHNRKLLTFVLIASFCLPAACALGQEATPPPPGEEIKPVPAKGQGPDQPPATETTEKQAEGPEGKEGPVEKPKGDFMQSMGPFVIMLGAIVLLYVWMGRGRRKQEAKRKEMLANLKKGDKVTSVGGIVGTIMDVREDEVVVKVDETNNIRMRFARWAIRGIGEQAKAERAEERK